MEDCLVIMVGLIMNWERFFDDRRTLNKWVAKFIDELDKRKKTDNKIPPLLN